MSTIVPYFLIYYVLPTPTLCQENNGITFIAAMVILNSIPLNYYVFFPAVLNIKPDYVFSIFDNLLAQKFQILWVVPTCIFFYIISIMVFSFLFKWIFIGRQKPGIIRWYSFRHLCLWSNHIFLRLIFTRCIGLLCLTPFQIFFYRLLGARIHGLSATISGPVPILDPDLIVLSENCHVGDHAMLVTSHLTFNGIRQNTITVGKNALVGAVSVVMPGVKIGNNTLLGALSLVLHDEELCADSSYAGAYPLKKISTQKKSETPIVSYNWIGFFYGIYTPLILFIIGGCFSLSAMYGVVTLQQFIGKQVVLVLSPFIILCIGIAWCLLCVGIKILAFGRLSSGISKHNGWEQYRISFVGLFMEFARHLLLEHLRGTVFHLCVYRALGAKLGQDVYLDTDWLLGLYNLISVGNNSIIGYKSELLASVVEGGVMKSKSASVGNNCTTGARTILGPNSSLASNGEAGSLTYVFNNVYAISPNTGICRAATPRGSPRSRNRSFSCNPSQSRKSTSVCMQ